MGSIRSVSRSSSSSKVVVVAALLVKAINSLFYFDHAIFFSPNMYP